jgi:beta-fructofuranosidase
VIGHDDGWAMLYTGRNRTEAGLVQRIGLATSTDLVQWTKHAANPVLEADPRWYELLDRGAWHDQAWRDPWLFRERNDDAFHALVTARANHGPSDGRGVIGHARSLDLLDWEVLPPLTQPGDAGELEVPQLVAANERFYLLFSTLAERWSARRAARRPAGGTFYFVGDDSLGPFELPDDPALTADRDGSLYAGKLVADRNGPGSSSRSATPGRTARSSAS